MIIVTGATGQLGRAIVESLVERVPASQVGASVRDPAKASALAALGVRVRRGDFDDPASLAHAFEGATQVLIVSSNASAYGGDPLAQHRSAIEAARAAGARRIVYTSHMAASSASLFPPMLDHVATEEMLRESGLAWTALRNGFYASSGMMFIGDALKTGALGRCSKNGCARGAGGREGFLDNARRSGGGCCDHLGGRRTVRGSNTTAYRFTCARPGRPGRYRVWATGATRSPANPS